MKILVIALSGLGDALLFTPAASLIRKHLPDDRLDALVMFKSAGDIYRQSGLFHRVIFHDFLKAPVLSSLKTVFGLRDHYDASITVYPSNRREYNVIQFLIGAKKRAAVKYPRRDPVEFGFLNNKRIPENDLLHNVQENIRLSEELLGFTATEEPDLVFPLTERDCSTAGEFVVKAGIKDGDTVVGFHAGSATFKNQIKRRWDPQKFSQLAERLAKEKDAWILLFGGSDETALKKQIGESSRSPKVLIPPSGTIIESAALMKRCNALVTNDSGMMHVAAALKVPTVAIIGPTNTNYIHPWHNEYEIASLYLDCSPCFYYSPRPLTCSRKDVKFKCVKELGVEMVYDRINHLLERTQNRK